MFTPFAFACNLIMPVVLSICCVVVSCPWTRRFHLLLDFVSAVFRVHELSGEAAEEISRASSDPCWMTSNLCRERVEEELPAIRDDMYCLICASAHPASSRAFLPSSFIK